MVGSPEVTQQDAAEIEQCAAVGRLDIGGWYCSGVLIHPRIVVTVAHCGPRGGRAIPRAVALRTSDLRVTEGAEIIEAKFITHPDFTSRGFPFDIALMILDHPSSVSPMPIATAGEIAAAAEVIMAGFGCETEDPKAGPRLRRSITAPIEFFSREPACAVPESLRAVHFDPAVEFAAGRSEAGPCFGDSGGPVCINVGGTPKLAGIISRPAARQKPFCKGPMILTRMDAFREWIEDQAPALAGTTASTGSSAIPSARS